MNKDDIKMFKKLREATRQEHLAYLRKLVEHHRLLVDNAAEQLLTRAAYGLALDDTEFETFVAGELEDLQESVLDEEWHAKGEW